VAGGLTTFTEMASLTWSHLGDGIHPVFIRDHDKLVKIGMGGESATAMVYSAWGAARLKSMPHNL
jgi:hypothetical protein